METKIKIRIFLWLVLTMLVFLLLFLGIVPFGQISYFTDFSKKDYFIGKIGPEERATLQNEGGYRVKGDPAYFSLFTPRTFDSATITVKFKNESGQPIIETGVLKDKTVWSYQTRPLQNKILDGLLDKWSVVKQGEVILLQKTKDFETVDQFLNNPPARNQIAIYNHDWNKDILLEDYAADSLPRIINLPLRGAYQFNTYVKNEELNLKFYLSDLNLNKDSDPVEIRVYRQGQMISSKSLGDDGIVDDSGQSGLERELTLKIFNLPEGSYKIEFKANDDILTERIETSLKKISFINKIWLAEGNKNLILFTDSQIINLQTNNPSKVQSVRVGDKQIEIKETFRQYSTTTEKIMTQITIDKDDLIVSGDGVFSFSEEELFNPNPIKIIPSFDSEKRGIRYILATYEQPQKLPDGYLSASARLDLIGAYREKGRYSFVLAVPGLKAEENSGWLEVKEIGVKLSGSTLFEKIKRYLGEIL